MALEVPAVPSVETLIVPLPITRLPGTRTVSALLPRTTVLLDKTVESAPMAVAWLRPSPPTLALLPMRVLFVPTRLKAPVFVPKNELLAPDVLLCPAFKPTNELFSPVVLFSPARLPKNELALLTVLL